MSTQIEPYKGRGNPIYVGRSVRILGRREFKVVLEMLGEFPQVRMD